MKPEPIPFLSERTVQLREKVISLGAVQPALDCQQLVRGWLTVGGLSIIYGPSNCGKTFFTTDMAMHIAAGAAWRDCRVEGGHVVYLAAEGGAGIFNRIAALKQSKPALCDHDRFHLLPCPVDLQGKEDAMALAQLLPDADIALIVVDTLARTIGDGDENSAKDMSVFIQNLDAIRELTGAHVLVIHHSGKDADRGARGSSALRAAVDTELSISAERCVTSAKQRDIAISPPIHFDLTQVELGQDQYGDPVTSAVVVATDAPKTKPKPLRGKAEVAVAALRDAIREHGEEKHGSDWPRGRKVVHVDHWKNTCAHHGLTTGGSRSAARMAFVRAKDQLIEKDKARIYNDFAWLVDNDQ